jgi:GNAT superfamily N-acetyltransferase
VIRRATVEDARAIGEVQLRSWWWAYREIVDHTHLSEHDPDEREAAWRDPLAADADVWVFDEGGMLAGFVRLLPAEVAAIYVDPPAQGAGVGGALLTHAEARLAAAGAEEAHLWVLEANEHARRWYESRGWVLAEGTQDRGWAPEVRYRKELGG